MYGTKEATELQKSLAEAKHSTGWEFHLPASISKALGVLFGSRQLSTAPHKRSPGDWLLE